ncbi:hypothetical protein BT96DRAFT_1012247, partial [Gymnopus androsaceus JB14]
MAHFSESISQCVWPKERVSTRLCAKCGDSFQMDLHELKLDETIRRVRSGYSPDVSERAVYSKLLEDAQEEMDRCQTELRRLQELSQAIEAQQELLGTYMAGIRCIMSPIYKLPQEMLGEIFQYVCCGDISANRICYYRRDQLPTLTLSRVCIRWYRLVTAMPVLWSSFAIDSLDKPVSSSLLNMFLARSRSHPIDFTFDGYYSYAIPAQHLASLTTVDNTSRWRHVAISVEECSVVEAILQPLIDGSRNLPGLVSLHLDAPLLTTLSFPVDCPSLRSLTLDRVPLDLEYPRLTVTYLDLRGLSPEETFRLIRCCPNIQMLALRQPVEREEEVTEAINISCNTAMFTVAFGASDHNALHKIFDSVTFPKLIHLELFQPNWRVIEPQNFFSASLCSMLERCQLTHLTIHSVPFISAELLRLFLC